MVIYILLTINYFVIGIFSGLFYATWFDRDYPSFTCWIIGWPLMIIGIVVMEIVEGIIGVFERIDNLPKRFRTWWHDRKVNKALKKSRQGPFDDYYTTL
jgi:uncharacterized protein HemY